jgi:hypothetical protein
LKLKELEDFDWFPQILRKYQMEYIGFFVTKLGILKKSAEIIKARISLLKCNTIIDLCSGSGLPAIYTHKRINNAALQTILTDKYPQIISGNENIKYEKQSVDILNLAIKPNTFYTIYNAFHHFDEMQQEAIIRKFIDAKSNLLIVEVVKPSLLNFIQVTIAGVVGVILVTPIIRPFDLKRWFFTYVIPINILTVLIDGYISILKSRSMSQYNSFLSKLFPNTNVYVVEEHFSFPAYITTIKISHNYD